MRLLYIPVKNNPLQLTLHKTYFISKRFYPKVDKVIGHAAKILNASPMQHIPTHTIPKETTQTQSSQHNVGGVQPITKPTNSEPSQKLNPNNELQKHTHQTDKIIMEAKKHQELLQSKKPLSTMSSSSEKALIEKITDEKGSYTLSGLKDLPQEYLSGTAQFCQDFKTNFITVYSHILFTLAYYDINSDQALLKYIGKFMQSITPTLHKTTNYKEFRENFYWKLMSDKQHLLVNLCKNKLFNPREHANNPIFAQVDLNMFKRIPMLTVIECFVINKTLSPLFKDFSFVLIDPDSPLLNESTSVYGYDRNISLQKIGQMHGDGIGVNALCDSKGIIILDIIYKDVKMFESGAINGRLTLKPDLIYNKKALKEYLTKVIGSYKQHMKKNNLENNTHYKRTLDVLEEQNAELKKCNVNLLGDFLNKGDKEIAKNIIDNINDILLKEMKKPNSTNWGLSIDPGRDEEFIKFYDKYLKFVIQDLSKDISDEDFAGLHSSKITPENEESFNKTADKIASNFPEEFNGINLRENSIKALKYLFPE